MVAWSLSSNLLLKASRILSLAKDTTEYEVFCHGLDFLLKQIITNSKS